MRARMQGWVATAVAGAVVGLAVPLGALATGGAAGAAPGGGTWTGTPCVDTTHAFGQATGWTEFVQGDGHRTSESEGSVAYGGNLPTGMSIGSDLTVSATTPTLVVAGSHGEWFNLQKGSAFVVPETGVNHNSGGAYLSTNPIDFPTAFAELRERSTQWGAAPATGAAVRAGADEVNRVIELRGTDPKLNVFSLTQADLTEAKTIAYDVPTGAAVLVNVRGTSVRVTSKMTLTPGGAQPTTHGVQARGPFIWNFPEATSLTFDVGSDFGGHVLAPRADVVVQLGVLIGQTIAKSFRSPNETHVAMLPPSVCLPPTTPPTTPTPTPTPTTPVDPPVDPPLDPPVRSDVTITKTASSTTPRGGDALTYRLTARNVGAAAATGVTVTDALPAGVTLVAPPTGCTVLARVLTCTAGTLAVGASASWDVPVTVDPVAGAGAPADRWLLHELTPTKQEVHVDLEPGETRTVNVACAAPDALLSDGQVRVDHVDQGTGELTDVRVLRSQSTGTGSWKVVLRNEATGRAQAKAFAVCLPGSTEVTEGHRHALSLDPEPVTSTQVWGTGRQTATLACPAGTAPVVPGFALAGGAARWSGSEPVAAGGTSWRFTFDVTDPATVELSLRCLRREVASADGHTHALRLDHVVRTVTLPPGQVVEEQVICADDAKGITATWSLPPGVVHLGNDPRLKARAFRLLNTTGGPVQAVVDLECLADRPGPEVRGHAQPVVVANTATVTSTSVDADPTNNSATATVSVTPGSTTAVPAAAAGIAGRTVTLPVVSSMPGTARVVLRSGGKAVGRAKVSLRPGGVATARVTLTKAGRKAVLRAGRVTAVVDPTRGPATRRTVRLR